MTLSTKKVIMVDEDEGWEKVIIDDGG